MTKPLIGAFSTCVLTLALMAIGCDRANSPVNNSDLTRITTCISQTPGYRLTGGPQTSTSGGPIHGVDVIARQEYTSFFLASSSSAVGDPQAQPSSLSVHVYFDVRNLPSSPEMILQGRATELQRAGIPETVSRFDVENHLFARIIDPVAMFPITLHALLSGHAVIILRSTIDPGSHEERVVTEHIARCFDAAR